MNISSNGIAMIKKFEGFSSKVYLDVNGFRTIGYGHKLLPNEQYPKGITEAEASVILFRDAAVAVGAVNRLVHVTLTQNQCDALCDFIYNLGEGSFASSTLLKDLNAGRYTDAAKQLLLWDHAGNKVIQALKDRRTAEYNLFLEED